MNVTPAVSWLALGMAFAAWLLTLAALRMGRRPEPVRRWNVMAAATLALGVGLFALFFGLVSGCDRL